MLLIKDKTIYSVEYSFTLKDTYTLTLYVDAQNTVIGIYFSHSKKNKNVFRTLPDTEISITSHPRPRSLQITQELDAYFNGTCAQFTAPYRFVIGTEFQTTVWKHIALIPPHAPLSYTDIAKKIHTARALPVRAVGTATGANPLSILVPCHRVLPKNTAQMWACHAKNKKKARIQVGNYAGSTKLKQQLLELEAKYYYNELYKV